MTRRSFLSMPALAAAGPAAAQSTRGGLVLENTVESAGGFTLAHGPKVEGVVFLRQVPEVGAYDTEKLWPADVVQAFHAVPWIDAASVRVRWPALEPRPGEFDWIYIDHVLAEVKKFNAAHGGAVRTLQIRPMGGEHCPRWFEQAGVRFYDTTHPAPDNLHKPLRSHAL